ncbi:hypothetical protein Droror1_Dr00019307 [Drosera rotundifolia]
MASGSSVPTNSPSKGFDFASSDDILCSYEDYHDNNNPPYSDSLISTTSSAKDFHKSRMSRSSLFPTTIYSQPEDTFNEDMVSAVERTMKKHTDNLMRFLEGISSRLSQLELYCYNLDKSIGEMRSDLVRDHGEAETKLKSLDKNLQEVHRAVQILRDKQELADTQKELAKLQLAQKESSSEEKSPAPKKADDSLETREQQLALALPNQFAPQPQPQSQPQPSRPIEQQQSYLRPSQTPQQTLNQPPPYYMPPSQLQNPQTQNAAPHAYMPADSAYRVPPMAPQPSQNQVNQPLPAQPYPPYPHQWPQQVSQPQPVQPPQQPPIQPQNQAHPSPSGAYPPYMRTQPTNPPPPETITGSMAMQAPYSGHPQPGVGHGEALPYGYGGAGRPVPPQPQSQPQQPQQQPPQHIKGGFTTQRVEGYGAAGPHPPVSSGGAYMMYDSEGGRPHQPPQQTGYVPGGYPSGGYPPGPYPPGNVPQNPLPPSSAGVMAQSQSAPHYFCNHPHGELIDKLVSMGYRGDHVASIIQRLEERGRPVDFNVVLDSLNGGSSGGSQRAW